MIDQAGFSGWSISYNKWTEKLEELARQLPESAWSGGSSGSGGSNSGGQGTEEGVEQYSWLRQKPGDCRRAHVFAVVRSNEPGGVVLPVRFCDV